jgi:hypothetical protein
MFTIFADIYASPQHIIDSFGQTTPLSLKIDGRGFGLYEMHHIDFWNHSISMGDDILGRSEYRLGCPSTGDVRMLHYCAPRQHSTSKLDEYMSFVYERLMTSFIVMLLPAGHSAQRLD